MYENVNYAETRVKWLATRKKMSLVSKDYEVDASTARSFLLGRLNPNKPDEGQHAKVARMLEKEGCLVFKKLRKKVAA